MNSFIKNEIIKYKSENPKAKTKDICDKFNISLRTAYRYLSDINQQKREEEAIPEQTKTLKEIFESFVLSEATNKEEIPEHESAGCYEYIVVDESFPSPTEQEEQNSTTEDRYFLIAVIINNQYYSEIATSGENFPNRKEILNKLQGISEDGVEFMAVQNIYEFKNKNDHDVYLSE